MRKVVPFLLLLTAIGCEKREGPKPRAVTVTIAESTDTGSGLSRRTIAVGDTSTYTITYVLDRAPRTVANGGPDTVRVNLRRDSTSISVPLLAFGTKLRYLQRDTASFKVPKVFGFPAKYTACVQVRKTVVIVPNKCQSWQTNLPAKVDTTPPTRVDSVLVDSVMAVLVRPEQVTVSQTDWEAVGVYRRDTMTNALYSKTGTKLAWTCPSGGTGKCPAKQFCAFVRLGNGSVAMTANSATIVSCQKIFDQIPGHLPTYAPAFYVLGPGAPAPPISIAINTGSKGPYVAGVSFNNKPLARARNGDWVDPARAPLIQIFQDPS